MVKATLGNDEWIPLVAGRLDVNSRELRHGLNWRKEIFVDCPVDDTIVGRAPAHAKVGRVLNHNDIGALVALVPVRLKDALAVEALRLGQVAEPDVPSGKLKEAKHHLLCSLSSLSVSLSKRVRDQRDPWQKRL